MWLPLWRLLSAAPDWGKGVVVRAENPPLPFPSPNSGLRGPRGQGDVDGRGLKSSLPQGEGKGGMEARSSFSSSSYCALGITAPPASAPLVSHSDGPPPPLV